MLNKEEQIKKWINKKECLSHYYPVYRWFTFEEIDEITWRYFCQNCVFEIENVSDVLKRMKERDSE